MVRQGGPGRKGKGAGIAERTVHEQPLQHDDVCTHDGTASLPLQNDFLIRNNDPLAVSGGGRMHATLTRQPGSWLRGGGGGWHAAGSMPGCVRPCLWTSGVGFDAPVCGRLALGLMPLSEDVWRWV